MMLSFRRFASPPPEESYSASPNNSLFIAEDGSSSSSSQHCHYRSQHIFRMPSASTVVILPEPHDAPVVDHQHEGYGHDQEEGFMKKPKFYRVALWKPVVTLLAVFVMVRLAPPSAPMPRAVRHRRTKRSIRKKARSLPGLLREDVHATVVVVVDARPQPQQQQDPTISGTSDGAAAAWSGVLGLVGSGLDPSLVCTAIPSVQAKRLNAANNKQAASMGHDRSKRVHSLRKLRAGASKPQSSSAARFAHCPPTTRYWVDFQTTAILQPENLRQWYPADTLRVILLVPDNAWDGDREGARTTRLKQTEHYPEQSHAKNHQFMEHWFRTIPRPQLMVVTASQVQQPSSTLVARAANFMQNQPINRSS